MTDSDSHIEPSKSSSRRCLLGTVGLIVALLATGFAALNYWQYRQVFTHNLQAQQQLHRQWQQFQIDNKASVKAVQAQLRQQQQQTKALSDNVLGLLQKSSASKRAQTLLEVGYLVRVASIDVSVTYRVPTALRALSLAYQHVHALHDTSLYALENALHSDITQLQKVAKQVRVPQIAQQLNGLVRQIQTIDLLPTQSKALSAQSDVPQGKPFSHKNWYSFLSGFKQFIIIRHHQKPMAPLLSTVAFNAFKQSMAIQLASAQWALLRHNDALFHQSLGIVLMGLDQQLPPSKQRAAIKGQLQSLNAINIAPTLPDLSDSLAAIARLSALPASVPARQQPKAPAQPAPAAKTGS